MRAKFTKGGYIIKELNGFINSEIKILNIIDRYQAYIENKIEEKLFINYNLLILSL